MPVLKRGREIPRGPRSKAPAVADIGSTAWPAGGRVREGARERRTGATAILGRSGLPGTPEAA